MITAPTVAPTRIPTMSPSTTIAWAQLTDPKGATASYPLSAAPLWPGEHEGSSSGNGLITPVSGSFRDALHAAASRSRASKDLLGTPVSQAQAVLQGSDGAFYLTGLQMDVDGKQIPGFIDGPGRERWGCSDVLVGTRWDSVKAIVSDSSWVNLSDRASGRPEPLPAVSSR